VVAAPRNDNRGNASENSNCGKSTATDSNDKAWIRISFDGHAMKSIVRDWKWQAWIYGGGRGGLDFIEMINAVVVSAIAARLGSVNIERTILRHAPNFNSILALD